MGLTSVATGSLSLVARLLPKWHGPPRLLATTEEVPRTLHALRGDGVDVDDGPGLPKGTYYRLDVTPDGRITSATFAVP